MLSGLLRLCGIYNRPSVPRIKTTSVRLSFDRLEDRCVPATLTWNWRTGNPTNQWGDARNWLTETGAQAQNAPGAQDIGVFNGTSNSNCVVTANTTISSLRILNGYTGIVSISQGFALTVNGAETRIEAGTLGGQGNVNVNSQDFTWSGGTMSGTGTTTIALSGANPNTAAISGADAKTIDTRRVEIQGNGAWTGAGNIVINNGGTLFLNAAAQVTDPTFDVTATGGIRTMAGVAGMLSIQNRATFKSNPGVGGNLTIGTSLQNNGKMNLESGDMTLSGSTTTVGTGSTQTTGGIFVIPAGRKVSFAGSATHTLRGAYITGTGMASFASGSTIALENPPTGTNNITNAEQLGGQINGAGNMSILGTFRWEDGSWSGTGTTTVAGSGVLRIDSYSTIANPLVLARSLVNNGTVRWESGFGIQTQGAASITNAAGSLFEVRSNGALFRAQGAMGTLINAPNATFRKTASNGITRIEMPFTNRGTWDIQSGVFEMANPLVVQGNVNINGGNVTALAGMTQDGGTVSVALGYSFDVTGTYDQNGGELQISGAVTTSAGFTEDGGTLRLSGGSLTATSGLSIASGATLLGSGTVTGNVTNSGEIELGDPDTYQPGTITINGNYTQNLAGRLWALHSPTATSLLDITGQASLAGAFELELTGTQPGVGDSFEALTYGSRTGTFSVLFLPTLGSGTWDPRYDDPAYDDAFSLWVV